MRIAIVTLPLHTNYGGLLQAYALRKVLMGLGHEVDVIDTDKRPNIRPWYLRPAVWGRNAVYKYLLHKDVKIFNTRQLRRTYEEYLLTTCNTRRFVDSYIRPRVVTGLPSIREHEYDAIVVGSDQIWRPRYLGRIGLANAYLSFAAKWDIKRIAYAASFGTDEWEYNPRDTAMCRDLVSRFDTVTVREDSAVALCKEHLGVMARHVLDPTLLLDRSDYLALASDAGKTAARGKIFAYILDRSDNNTAILDQICASTGKKIHVANANVENPDDSVDNRIQPPVEDWIAGLANCDFVVTDSFHACVFSIIFGKPFVAIGNRSRGLSRFQSLLRTFSLEDHLIATADDWDDSRDYSISPDTQDTLARLRSRSLEILSSSL